MFLTSFTPFNFSVPVDFPNIHSKRIHIIYRLIVAEDIRRGAVVLCCKRVYAGPATEPWVVGTGAVVKPLFNIKLLIIMYSNLANFTGLDILDV